jgi:hypothetical protein
MAGKAEVSGIVTNMVSQRELYSDIGGFRFLYDCRMMMIEELCEKTSCWDMNGMEERGMIDGGTRWVEFPLQRRERKLETSLQS